ncbi:hypothetical protein BCAR13_410089 [Paraburkholderia caribensis]|nr:hypothetical protein BCAR13_410089 [Paraburkholderia caribensis]
MADPPEPPPQPASAIVTMAATCAVVERGPRIYRAFAFDMICVISPLTSALIRVYRSVMRGQFDQSGILSRVVLHS